MVFDEILYDKKHHEGLGGGIARVTINKTGRPGKLLSIARRPRCLLVRSGNLVQSLHSAADARVDERELEPIMALRDSSYDRSLLCS